MSAHFAVFLAGFSSALKSIGQFGSCGTAGPERPRVPFLPSLRHSVSFTAMSTLLAAGPDGRACPRNPQGEAGYPSRPKSDL
ncbi:MAG: hypothetical protein FJ221_09945 [Lentisphaerae bacterium]|nr:hypothetical protein [Lentisphaerota bacterium]